MVTIAIILICIFVITPLLPGIGLVVAIGILIGVFGPIWCLGTYNILRNKGELSIANVIARFLWNFMAIGSGLIYYVD